MIRLVISLVKVSIFALVVLVLSHILKWNGKSLSDQVRDQMIQAEKSPVLYDLKEWSSKTFHQAVKRGKEKLSAASKNHESDDLSPEEQKQLRELLKQLDR